MTKLEDKAVLVQLKVSQWQGRKFDRKATQDVADLNGVSSAVGRYHKALLPATDMLANVHAKTAYIRAKYYKNTLPWGLEGTQILPCLNFMDFAADYRKERSEWVSLVADFLKEYPRLIIDAQGRLGKMFNENDYPPPMDMAKKFSMDMAIFPIPSTDFRVEIGDEELEGIKADIETRIAESSKAATQELWRRLIEPVQKMVDKLSDPSATFRDTLVHNVTELCQLMKKLNVSEDEDVEHMTDEMLEKLATKNPENLRLDPDLRRDTAEEAKKIMERMKTFMGGS